MSATFALPPLPPVPLRRVHARLEALIGQISAAGEEIDALTEITSEEVEDGLAKLGDALFHFRNHAARLRVGRVA